MSYAHEASCAHLRIQYCKESSDGLTHDWWECASCKMLFAPQGRASLPQWIQISERMPTREETNGHDNVWAVDERGTHWIWDYVMMPVSRFARPPIAWHAFPRYTPPKPRPTDGEIDDLRRLLYKRSDYGDAILEWFADVTARIEREEGK